eukprot:6177606-Pleurochrysis_carterae.AAC.2
MQQRNQTLVGRGELNIGKPKGLETRAQDLVEAGPASWPVNYLSWSSIASINIIIRQDPHPLEPRQSNIEHFCNCEYWRTFHRMVSLWSGSRGTILLCSRKAIQLLTRMSLRSRPPSL